MEIKKEIVSLVLNLLDFCDIIRETSVNYIQRSKIIQDFL